MALKKLTNKRLVSLLMDQRKINLVTIDKDKVLCECDKTFFPSDAKELSEKTGQSPRFATKDGENYIIFDRY